MADARAYGSSASNDTAVTEVPSGNSTRSRWTCTSNRWCLWSFSSRQSACSLTYQCCADCRHTTISRRLNTSAGYVGDRVRTSDFLALRFTFQDHELVRRVGALLASGLVLAACSGSGHHASSSASRPSAPTPSVGTHSAALNSITGHLFAVGGLAAGLRPLSGRV